MPRDKFNYGTLGKLQDVFGEGQKCQWICPTNPFEGISNEELSVNYLNYYS